MRNNEPGAINIIEAYGSVGRDCPILSAILLVLLIGVIA